MKYNVVFTEKAKKELKKLDKHTALLIVAWIRKNLEGLLWYNKVVTA